MNTLFEWVLIGQSPAMTRLRELIEHAARARLPVLIEGPTGAGKELVAGALHVASGRSGALVAVNVCALGDSMFEDALFGHVRGAYTGAVADRAGFLREADKGTLFLDEIGGLAIPLQFKLLRAIEMGEFRPVGGTRNMRIDLRIVAATNEPLRALVTAHRFRADLAHRLGGVVIHVPSLDQRREDIPLLVRHFLACCGREGVSVSARAMDRLCDHPWPGNVRELKQAVEWAAVLCDDQLTEEALLLSLAHRMSDETIRDLTFDERAALRELLERHQWNTKAAARELGVHRATVYRRMKRLRLEAGEDSRDSQAFARTDCE